MTIEDKKNAFFIEHLKNAFLKNVFKKFPQYEYWVDPWPHFFMYK